MSQLCFLYTACVFSYVSHVPAALMPTPLLLACADVCAPAAEQDIMKNIFKACKDASKEYNTTIQGGANIAGFLKVRLPMRLLFPHELLCSTELWL